MVFIQRYLSLGITLWAALPCGCSAVNDYLGRERANNEWLQHNQAKFAGGEASPEPEILPVTHFAAGQLFEQQGQLQGAIQQYRKALDLNPKFIIAYNRLGICLDRIGRPREAERVLREAVRIAPEQPYLRNNLAFNLIVQRRWQEAEEELLKTLQLRPGYDRARVNLAIALNKQGRHDSAFEQFRMVLGEAMAHYNLGLLYKSDGAYRPAAEAFRQAIASEPKFFGAKLQLQELQSLVSATATLSTEIKPGIMDVPSEHDQQPAGDGMLPQEQADVPGIARALPIVTPSPAPGIDRALDHGIELSAAAGRDHLHETDARLAQAAPSIANHSFGPSAPSEFMPPDRADRTPQTPDAVDQPSPTVTRDVNLQVLEDDVQVAADQTTAIVLHDMPQSIVSPPEAGLHPVDEFDVAFVAEQCDTEAAQTSAARPYPNRHDCEVDELVDQFVFDDGGYDNPMIPQMLTDAHGGTSIDHDANVHELLPVVEDTVARWISSQGLATALWTGPGLVALLSRLQADLLRHQRFLSETVQQTSRDEQRSLRAPSRLSRPERDHQDRLFQLQSRSSSAPLQEMDLQPTERRTANAAASPHVANYHYPAPH